MDVYVYNTFQNYLIKLYLVEIDVYRLIQLDSMKILVFSQVRLFRFDLVWTVTTFSTYNIPYLFLWSVARQIIIFVNNIIQ